VTELWVYATAAGLKQFLALTQTNGLRTCQWNLNGAKSQSIDIGFVFRRKGLEARIQIKDDDAVVVVSCF